MKQLFICYPFNCSKSKTLWNSLKEFFKDTITLPSLTPQSAIFGFLQTNQELFLILNYLLLLFKYYLYVSRCSKTISFAALKINIKKTYILEKNLSKYDEKKKRFFLENGVKFRFISNHVITFSMGGFGFISGINLYIVVFNCFSRHMIYFNTFSFKDFVRAEVHLGFLWSLRLSSL